MLRPGSIYKDKTHDDRCFIVLHVDTLNDGIFGVDIKNLQDNQFSNIEINKKLQIIDNQGFLNADYNNPFLYFWRIIVVADFKNINDGYLGQINDKKLLKKLTEQLYETAAWKSYS